MAGTSLELHGCRCRLRGGRLGARHPVAFDARLHPHRTSLLHIRHETHAPGASPGSSIPELRPGDQVALAVPQGAGDPRSAPPCGRHASRPPRRPRVAACLRLRQRSHTSMQGAGDGGGSAWRGSTGCVRRCVATRGNLAPSPGGTSGPQRSLAQAALYPLRILGPCPRARPACPHLGPLDTTRALGEPRSTGCPRCGASPYARPVLQAGVGCALEVTPRPGQSL